MSVQRTALFAALLAAGGAAQSAESIAEMFTEGEGHIAFRYRLELVDQDGFREDGEASTLRTRVNFRTADLNGWSGFIEADDLREVGLDDFNAGGGTTPNRGQFPVIADPEYTEINQAFLQYRNDANQVRLGRQRINLDNQRFVGGVGWRQNEQTYDSVSFTNTALEGTTFFYAFVSNVNRIFGDDSVAGDHDNSTHLVNVSHQFEGIGKLTGYYYDIDNDDAPAFSTSTLGLRFTGKAEPGGWPVEYALEAARQDDAHNNPGDFDENYLRLDGAISFEPVKLSIGYEVLGGDSSSGAFRTPLATLHAFNGWADKFLSTPSAGLEDLFLGASGKIGPWNWNAVYHDFQPDDSGSDYGTELDLSLARKFGDAYGLLFKFADFSGDSLGFADTTKVWVMFSASF